MKLLKKEHERRLLAQGRWNAGRERSEDFKPIVKLFCPWSGATWLLSELDPEDHDLAFGLCDLGMGFPELGRVRLSELAAVRGPGGLQIERDRWFRAGKTLAAYAEEARLNQHVVA
jgi:hypothetical protein